MDNALSIVEKNKDVFGDILLFSWDCHGDSTVTSQFYNDVPVARLKATGLPYWATFTSGFNGLSAANLFDSPTKSNKLATNMVKVANSIGATGMDLDFESINFGHSGDSKARLKANYPKFIALLKSLAGNLKVSATIPARTSDDDPDWSVYDFAAIGKSCDLVRIMSYDYHTGGDTVGPVSPIGWYEKVQTYAKSRIPASKLHMGIPAYGYEWPSGRTINAKDADALARSKGTIVKYNTTYKEGTFSYDGNTVWVATQLSMQARVNSSVQSGVAGVAIWSIGDEPPEAWTAMRRYLPSSGPAPVQPSPRSVSLSNMKFGKTSPDILIVQDALKKEGLYASKMDSTYTNNVVRAYSKWQKKLGYSGQDANGIAGRVTLAALGKKYNFVVTA